MESNQIDDKLDFWKNRLLDLSKRNRLVNCRLPKSEGRLSRNSLLIREQSFRQLWDIFVNDDSKFVFEYSDKNKTTTNNFFDIVSESDTKSQTVDDKYGVQDYYTQVYKTLKNLKNKSKSFFEEKGLNTLYLAFGFLNWNEDILDNVNLTAQAKFELRSPIVLIPVTLRQDNIFSPFVLCRYDEEIEINPALQEKLLTEHGIILPKFDNDITNYLAQLQDLFSSKGWEIDRDVELGLFSFLKINMYKDLQNNAQKIKQNNLVKLIAGQQIQGAVDSQPTFSHDTTNPLEIYSVLDADSSQKDAIEFAKQGNSFILQGPPGTGKSQTITNMIAELIGLGKKVLFVSEKMAALDVVYKRLSSVGLGDFCLSLHSHKANRKDVLRQLERSLILANNKVGISNSAVSQLDQLQKRQSELNQYANSIHTTVQPLDTTIYNVFGELAQLESVPTVNFAIDGIQSVGSKELDAKVYFLQEFQSFVKEFGWQSKNPWIGCTVKKYTVEFERQFRHNVKNFFNLQEQLECLFKLIKIDSIEFGHNNFAILCRLLDELQDLLVAINKLHQDYNDLDFAFEIDWDNMFVKFEKKYRPTTIVLSKSYEQDNKVLQNLSKDNAKKSYQQRCEIVYNLTKVKQYKSKLKELGDPFFDFIINVDNCLTVKDVLERISNWIDLHQTNIGYFSSVLGFDSTDVHNLDCDNLAMRLQQCANSFANLQIFELATVYNDMLQRGKALGLQDYCTKAFSMELKQDFVVKAFLKGVYTNWLDVTVQKFDKVANFRRIVQDNCVKSFRELDKESIKICASNLIAKLTARLPSLDYYTSNQSELGVLKKELVKKARFMHIRRLLASLPNLLPILKPCIMMSPLSVSTYLGDSDYKFDVVIFDEASQVRTEDAIGAIFRAQQVIIAGDRNQLPPTNFFNVDTQSFDEFDNFEGDDFGAFESFLDEATMLPQRKLLWHYRSKHEQLIAFSNAKIYDNSLITFPSCFEMSGNLGVQYDFVDGYYDNGNIQEANHIAKLVFEHYKKVPHRSLGVIAFGETQQALIENELLKVRQSNKEFEKFFLENVEEPLFVKTLETVQGDERDYIILCIGYGKDVNKNPVMRFGPLNMVGGERRLNVAITRARYNIKLVGSIMPTDIYEDRIKNIGAKLLKQYIEYAIKGIDTIRQDRDLVLLPKFERSIFDFLTKQGYDIVPQIGCSEYKIDMALRTKDRVFAIGIECDGQNYNSARTCRERDRLRHSILKDMGWNLYRIWSTEWTNNRESERQRLLDAIEKTMHNSNGVVTPSGQIASIDTFDKDYLETKTEQTTVVSKYFGFYTDSVPIDDYKQTIIGILNKSFGISKEDLFKSVAKAYGWKSVGSRIRQNIDASYRQLLSSEAVTEVNGFVELSKI